jgi:DNA-binding MarR family transcriptional regulator
MTTTASTAHPGKPSARPGGKPPHLVQFQTASPIRRSTNPLARRFYQMCLGVQAQTLSPVGLTALEYSVMAYLNRDDGEPRIDQNSLAARLGVERSHASLIVEAMTTNGLVARSVNGADRRARLLSLTPKGEKLYRRVRPAVRAANARILEPLSPHQREQFFDMLIRMIEANGVHARPGADRRGRKAKSSAPDPQTP